VHIPYEVTWAHELADAPEGHPRYVTLARFDELPEWLARIERG
jgi:putative hydrolase of the HAD superfamily